MHLPAVHLPAVQVHAHNNQHNKNNIHVHVHVHVQLVVVHMTTTSSVVVHPAGGGVGVQSSDLSLLLNACITRPTLAPAVLRRTTRGPSISSVHYKRRVARVRRSPTPAALQVATSTARCSLHGQPCVMARPRDAHSLRCCLLLPLQPVDPARRARCPAASSSRPTMRLVVVSTCGARVERMNSDVTACMPCDGTGDGSSLRPRLSGLEGC